MIEPNVVARAEHLLNSQSFVPKSPAACDDGGQICLCSAGLLAMAGLESLDAEEARSFANRAASTRDDRIVYSAFARLGWPLQLCAEMQQQNDFTPPEARKAIVAGRLESLKRLAAI